VLNVLAFVVFRMAQYKYWRRAHIDQTTTTEQFKRVRFGLNKNDR
jgi:hypothetical protein